MNTTTSSHLQERWKEDETSVDRAKNVPALLHGLPKFGNVGHQSPQPLGKENSVVFPSHVDWSIASWACIYEENGIHLGSKKEAIFAEILQIPVTGSLSPWSICIFLMYVICDCGTRATHTEYRQAPYISGTDPYVGYSIQHTDQYHPNKSIMSVFAFSVKESIIKFIRHKKSNQLLCTFLCTNF